MSASARNECSDADRWSSWPSSSLAETLIGGTDRGASGRGRNSEQPAIENAIAARASRRRTASGSGQMLFDRADLALQALDLVGLFRARECVLVDAQRVRG